MRIGYFCGGFPYLRSTLNYKIGGGEKVAYNIAFNMAKRGHDVCVFTVSESSCYEVENLHNIKVYRYASLFEFYRRKISPSLIFRPNIDVDIVHVHIAGELAPLAASKLAKKKNIPLIATYHGDAVADKLLQKPGEIFHNIIIKKVLNFSNVIVSPSKHIINQSPLLHLYKHKIVVIPNGINLKDFKIAYPKEECKRKLRIPESDKVILFVGVLRPFKGVDVLIKAMQFVTEIFQNVQLIIIGEGEMRLKLERLTKELKLERNIKFTGFVGEDLKPMYYKSADIFCLPSITTQEIFGIVNLEAMACGVPIVASKVGGVPDVVKHGENGLLVPPRDPNALADAIIYLLENEDIRKKMGTKGKEIVENYAWEKIAEKYEKVYQSVLNDNRSSTWRI